MPPIYISYRPKDADIVEGIAQSILLSLGRYSLQMNPTKSCASNTKLEYHIDSMMHASEIVLIVVGKEWAGLDEFGRFRLSSADIPIHNELKIALRCEREVLIVLIDGAELPLRKEVPEKFHGIFDFPVVSLNPETFKADLAQFTPQASLFEWLKYWLSGVWIKRRTVQSLSELLS